MKAVCVYCGSSAGSRDAYTAAARGLGNELARRELALVYGGAHKGLMGILADAVLGAGGRAIGVIPQALIDKEIAHDSLDELHVVSSMHERKALMAERADAFIALPGGVGTLEELVETLTWAQLGLHGKPCGLLDVAGYYDLLRRFIDHAVAEGFVREAHRDMLLVDEDPGRLLDRFADWRPPSVSKWIEPARRA